MTDEKGRTMFKIGTELFSWEKMERRSGYALTVRKAHPEQGSLGHRGGGVGKNIIGRVRNDQAQTRKEKKINRARPMGSCRGGNGSEGWRPGIGIATKALYL